MKDTERKVSNSCFIQDAMTYPAGKKKDLQEIADLTKYSMLKLENDEAVTTDTLAKICRALECAVGDIADQTDY